MSQYWQHDEPLKCTEGHSMIWLGSAYWICSECLDGKGTIWVQTPDYSSPSTVE